MQQSVHDVLKLLESNQIKEALELCNFLASNKPEDADLQHLLGLIYAKRRDLNSALLHFKHALDLDPTQALFHNNISNTYKLLGNLDLATRHLHEALRLAPNNAESYNNLGSLYYTRGQITQAIPLFEKAIRNNPLNWEAHYNLANCYIKQDMVLQAISHYETVIKLNSQHANAKVNLAMALVSLHDYTAALPLLEEATINNPQHAELQGHLAEAYLDLGKSQQAMDQYKKALLLEPNRAQWHHNLAVLYLRTKQTELAKQHFVRSLELEPNNPTAQHMLSALGTKNSQNIETAPAEYINQLFDQYASYYNQHVTTQLNYKVPLLLRQAISKFLNDFSKQQNILDLGCGTGMCGVYFRDMADFLIGVDLSAEMLAQAKALGAYDGLCRCNILETIPGYNRQVFDLIISADVFVYIGDLKPLFQVLRGALRPNGKIAFTIENTDDKDNVVLQQTGRFAHGVHYIQQLCTKFNFHIDTEELIDLREQEGKKIGGRLYIISLINDGQGNTVT